MIWFGSCPPKSGWVLVNVLVKQRWGVPIEILSRVIPEGRFDRLAQPAVFDDLRLRSMINYCYPYRITGRAPNGCRYRECHYRMEARQIPRDSAARPKATRFQ